MQIEQQTKIRLKKYVIFNTQSDHHIIEEIAQFNRISVDLPLITIIIIIIVSFNPYTRMYSNLYLYI